MDTTKDQSSEIDTTLIVNISKEKFTWYINGRPIELEPGEAKEKPLYIAQIGAKHMVDKILQEEHGVKDSLRDSPLRQSLFAKILPNMAEERSIKPLNEVDFREQVLTELNRQKAVLDSLRGVDKKPDDGYASVIESLKTEVASLKASLAAVPRIGRPPGKKTS